MADNSGDSQELTFDDGIFSLPTVGIENLSTDTGREYNAMDNILREIECCMPVQVVRYDRLQHVALVQPLVSLGGSEDKSVALSRFWVTVMRHHAGNYLIDFPIVGSVLEDESDIYNSKIKKGGDTGWVIAADRNTFNAKSMNPDHRDDKDGVYIGYDCMKGPQPLTVANLHRYSDGFFVLDRWNHFPLAEEDLDKEGTGDKNEDRMVIQTADGRQRISLWYGDGKHEGDIRVYASNDDKGQTTAWINGGEVTIVNDKTPKGGASDKTTITIEGGKVTIVNDKNVNLTVKGSGGTTLTSSVGGVHITGNTDITGTLTVSGLITANGDAKTGNVTLGTHKHTSAASGSPTSTPIP